MGKARTPYNNKPRHKPAGGGRPNNNGKPYIKRPQHNRTGESSDEMEVTSNSKTYQKAVQSRDKYRELAREAMVAGDRVAAENYHQHADHYGRIINAAHEADQERQQQRRQREKNDEAAAAEAQEGAVESEVAYAPGNEAEEGEQPDSN